jgi:hypothetical protein
MNPRALWMCLLGCGVLWVGEALAEGQEAPVTDGSPGLGLALGVRMGAAVPVDVLGGPNGGANLREQVSAIAPVQLDVGVLQDSRLYAGAYFQHSVGLGMGGCSLGASSCVVTDLRVGLTASYHFPVASRWSPWLGLGAGCEVFGELSSSFSAMAMEFVNVQGGADFQISRRTWVGPFATVTVSNFGDEEGFHSWFIGGVRLQVRL